MDIARLGMTKPFDLMYISVHRTLQTMDLYEKDGVGKFQLDMQILNW
jgi:hypothetical protein